MRSPQVLQRDARLRNGPARRGAAVALAGARTLRAREAAVRGVRAVVHEGHGDRDAADAARALRVLQEDGAVRRREIDDGLDDARRGGGEAERRRDVGLNAHGGFREMVPRGGAEHALAIGPLPLRGDEARGVAERVPAHQAHAEPHFGHLALDRRVQQAQIDRKLLQLCGHVVRNPAPLNTFAPACIPRLQLSGTATDGVRLA
mmetsp:Transcript_4802/g.15200  ORF Transcript_4802/g.15200 Transcript_4802/m.15200 type:complete len:204 (-) Transcript_4802:2131-2742(-)